MGLRIIKQSTSVDLPIGPFLDATDGVTPETGLTLTQPDIRLKKNNGNWAQKAAAQTLSHEENGNYEVTLDATDTNTLGHLQLQVFESGACPVKSDFLVVNANMWDSLVGGTDTFDVNVASFTAGALTRAALAADTGLQSARSNTAQTGAATTITLDASASAVDDFYNGNGIQLTGGTGAGQVRLITDYVGATKVATVHEAWATNPDATSTFAIGPGADVPTAAEIADAVWDEATTSHTTSGTFGEQLKTDVDAILADTNELQTDWVNGGRLDLLIDATLADTNELQTDLTNGGRLDLLIDATLADTAELQTDWVNGGRLDNILDARSSQASVDTIDNFVDDLEGRITAAVGTVLAAHGLAVGQAVLAAGSTTTSIVLNTVNGAAASATNDHYNNRVLILTSGALALQAATITDYVGGTKTLTVSGFTGNAAEGVTAIIA